VTDDTPPGGTPIPYDVRLFLKVAGVGAAAALVFSLPARVFSDSLRINESLVVGWVLTLVLSGVYTWLCARQPDAARLIPLAVIAVLLFFAPQDLLEARGNVEVLERFWNALPIYAALIGSSAMLGWLLWAPTVRKWLGKGHKPAPAPKAGVKKKKRRPAPAPEPEPEPELEAPTEEEEVPEEPRQEPLKRPAITTELPKLRKPRG
jgi:hypothetical protein